MNIQRLLACALFAAALLTTGCKKKEAASTSTGSAGSGGPVVVVDAAGSAADTTGSAGSAGSAGSGVASTNPPPKIGTGDPAPAAALTAIKLSPPKGAPATTVWKEGEDVEEGNRAGYFYDGKDAIMIVRIIDCRRTLLKDYVSKPADQRGEFRYCFDSPTGMLKGFDLIAPADAAQHAVRAGNIVVIAQRGNPADKNAVKADALDGWLESLDLAAIAKL
jgi:hypothetical protein